MNSISIHDNSNVNVEFINIYPNIYPKILDFNYRNTKNLKIRNVVPRKLNNEELNDCASCGGGGCGRCSSKYPYGNICDCGSCGGGGCGRCS